MDIRVYTILKVLTRVLIVIYYNTVVFVNILGLQRSIITTF